jgi:hypothetical protein
MTTARTPSARHARAVCNELDLEGPSKMNGISEGLS